MNGSLAALLVVTALFPLAITGFMLAPRRHIKLFVTFHCKERKIAGMVTFHAAAPFAVEERFTIPRGSSNILTTETFEYRSYSNYASIEVISDCYYVWSADADDYCLPVIRKSIFVDLEEQYVFITANFSTRKTPSMHCSRRPP